jgi:transcriptional regulator with XRE-family HTH domain
MSNLRRTVFGELCYVGRSRIGLMTCAEMARNLGVTVIEVNEFERGEKQPSKMYVQAVIGLLGLNTEEVLSSLRNQYGSSEFIFQKQSNYGAE